MKLALSAVSALFVVFCIDIAQAQGTKAAVADHSSLDSIAITVDQASKKKVTFGAGFVLETGINGGSEGGLYPELLSNRDFAEVELKWLPVGQGTKVAVVNDGASVRRVASVTGSAGTGSCGISNAGFHGKIDFIPGPHRLFFSIKSNGPQPVKKSFKAGLYSVNGNLPMLEGSFEITITNKWQRYAFKLNGKDSGTAGEPAVFILQAMEGCGPSGFQLSTVSLFGKTWNNLPIRADLGDALADLKPAYVRIAAGNDLVGANFASFFNWTQSVGFIDERIGRGSSWGGRHLSNGFGLMEQLDLADRLGALPILGIYAGWSFGQVASQNEMPQFVKLALDLLHFCLDDSSTSLGKLRAQYGRERPYVVRQVEIGNEDFATPQSKSTYGYRYRAIATAIKQAFPQIEIIATTDVEGSSAIDVHRYGEDFGDMYPNCHIIPASSKAQQAWMLEYAARGSSFPTLRGSLAEAVGLLGMEMNGDVNRGAAYAPLLQNLDDGKKPDWNPSLIAFDSQTLARSTSYFILQGFGRHRIGTSFQAKASVDPHTTKLFHSVGLSQDGQSWYIKLVNTDEAPKTVSLNLGASVAGARVSEVWQVKGVSPEASNTLGSERIVSTTSNTGDGSVTLNGNALHAVVPPSSFTIFTLSAGRAPQLSATTHSKRSPFI